MSAVAEFIRGAHHGMPKVVDDENQAAIFCLRDNDAVVFFEHTLLKDQVGSSRGHNTLLDFRLVHLADFIGMHSGAVDNDFGFHWELFAFRVLTIDTDSTDDLAAVVFEESFEFNVVGKRGAFHARDEIVHSCGKEAVKVHPRVVHLGLRHDRAPLSVQRFHIWISLT